MEGLAFSTECERIIVLPVCPRCVLQGYLLNFASWEGKSSASWPIIPLRQLEVAFHVRGSSREDLYCWTLFEHWLMIFNLHLKWEVIEFLVGSKPVSTQNICMYEDDRHTSISKKPWGFAIVAISRRSTGLLYQCTFCLPCNLIIRLNCLER